MLLYKVDYLKPNNYKAMSGLAWCLFEEGDYEKAMTYYDKLSQHEDFSVDDALNGGHTFWALGAKDIAREYYRKAKALIDNDVKFAEKMIEDAEYLKHLGLSDEDIVILINQILF
jgi:tetratricopeptide (TPR) repeat protein